VPSHLRLDAMLKQMEMLRTIDAQAHEAVQAELRDQVAR
jgi:hypothetical protein